MFVSMKTDLMVGQGFKKTKVFSPPSKPYVKTQSRPRQVCIQSFKEEVGNSTVLENFKILLFQLLSSLRAGHDRFYQHLVGV